MALPITRRPLFPGFYKAVVVKDPSVVGVIKEMMKRGQPYIGAFLLKDENADSDIITDIESIHRVGVFAQITSIFPANQSSSTLKDDEKDESLTVVLYPHRRIRINELLPIRGSSTAKIEEVVEAATEGEKDQASVGRKEEGFTPRASLRFYEWKMTLMINHSRFHPNLVLA
jgi:Lon-like ATP-dependent protease